jgi:hypothetical protein
MFWALADISCARNLFSIWEANFGKENSSIQLGSNRGCLNPTACALCLPRTKTKHGGRAVNLTPVIVPEMIISLPEFLAKLENFRLDKHTRKRGDLLMKSTQRVLAPAPLVGKTLFKPLFFWRLATNFLNSGGRIFDYEVRKLIPEMGIDVCLCLGLSSKGHTQATIRDNPFTFNPFNL